MRCDQCKHWEPTNGLYGDTPIGVGECMKPKALWECSDWTEDDDYTKIRRIMKPEFANDKMFVQDASDYNAHLMTRPDFYCAEFDQKGVGENVDT